MERVLSLKGHMFVPARVGQQDETVILIRVRLIPVYMELALSLKGHMYAHARVVQQDETVTLYPITVYPIHVFTAHVVIWLPGTSANVIVDIWEPTVTWLKMRVHLILVNMARVTTREPVTVVRVAMATQEPTATR